MSSKIYPIGIQNFESLRRDNYFYIDKTALIYQMVKTGRYYFHPRSLFPGEEGTVHRVGDGEAGKGLDKLSSATS